MRAKPIPARYAVGLYRVSTAEQGQSGLRALPRSSDSRARGCQSAKHDADHGEADEGGSLAGVALVVAAQTPVAADPGQGTLHDPAFRQHHEAVHIRALDDLKPPRAGVRDQRSHLRPLIATVSDDALDERKAPACLAQQCLTSVPVLNVGRVHVDAQQETERVDEDVALAPEHFLARIIPAGIKRTPPFTAPLALWASMIAVVGLASRPACSRLWT